MVYIYLFFLMLLLAGVVMFFFLSLRGGRLPANAQLLVDAWNLISDKRCPIDSPSDRR